MPPKKRGKANGGASPEGGCDGISTLPDYALHHVLSFLPAEEAVRTCVLARRWRHLWKSATGLRVGCGGGDDEPPSGAELRQFVNHLLLLRKRDSSLHTCELRLRCCNFDGDDVKLRVNLWIRHVLDRDVRVLRLEIQEVVSQHLITLALIGVRLGNNIGNFSTCPNLEHLEICKSELHCVDIASMSLKRLSVSDHCFFYERTLICTPSLVSLKIDIHFHSVLVLGSMLSLKEAFVRNHIEDCGISDCFSCNGGIPDEYHYSKNKSFLLEGLSNVENLTLVSGYDGAIFHRDWECCPTFNNLRVLLLNEWWLVHPDFSGLNCILKHSPVLENLTLYLLISKRAKIKVEIIGRYHQMEKPTTISKHLKAIEVKCEVVDKQVYKVLKFLGTFGIHFLFK